MTPSTHPKADLESNFCRNPDGDSKGPWCFTTDPDTRWETCNVQNCSEECMHCGGKNYSGKISTTENGYTCQHWDVQKPHNHGYITSALPEKYLEENYCRNPDGDPRPWCFTTSPSKRWDFCSIPRCTSEPPEVVEELTCATGDGSAYRGTIGVTASGKACQLWATQTPQQHNRTPDNYPCKGLELNYCRNPDNEKMPWCFTTDPETRWEYCKITQRPLQLRKTAMWAPGLTIVVFDLRRNLCRNPDGDRAPWCYTTEPSVRWEFCNCKVGNGGTYRGPTSMTMLGVTCQSWSAQSPHQHISFTPESHPDKGLESNNCRNPDNDVNGPCWLEMWAACYKAHEVFRSHRWRLCIQTPLMALADQPKDQHWHPYPYPYLWRNSDRPSVGPHRCPLPEDRPSAYMVVLGTHTERANEASKQERNLEKLILGPGGTDIALLKLDSPALINDNVLPVCLPEKDYVVPSGTECYVTGWGETQGTGGEGLLKETGFPVIENKVCNRPAYLNNRDDSGGPLVCHAQNTFVLQGVTSWGLGCADAMKPGVYIRVSKFMDWINNQMKINSSPSAIPP
ncbi:unnamed protein product [Coregonus sp. 'balchen']|nr:unnamed protein product [Coregonus sp. 'balchen']